MIRAIQTRNTSQQIPFRYKRRLKKQLTFPFNLRKHPICIYYNHLGKKLQISVYLRSIPSYLIWLKYISWFHYGNEAITIAQWKDIEGIDIHSNNLTCSPIPISNGTILIKTLGFKEVSFFQILNYLLLVLGLVFGLFMRKFQSHLVLDVMALLGIAFVIRLLAYLALLKRTFRKAKATSLK